MQYFVVCRIPEGTPRKNVIRLIREEAKAVWKLYESGIVRELYYIEDLSGAVLTVEATQFEDVKKAVETLPMIQAGLLEPDYIPLKPYTGFGKLFAK